MEISAVKYNSPPAALASAGGNCYNALHLISTMKHNEQENIDLREPVACWLKVLCSLIAGLLLAFWVACCRGWADDAEVFVYRLLVLVMLALPTVPFIVMALYFWWGKKYVVVQGNAVVIRLELLGFKRTRCIVTGRNSRLILKRVTIMSHDDHGGSAPKLELYITDAYGYRCRLLQFEESERERVLAICHEISCRLPELKSLQEE